MHRSLLGQMGQVCSTGTKGGGGGGDPTILTVGAAETYTSLQAAWDDIDNLAGTTDLTSAEESYTIRLLGEAFTGRTTLTGLTTSATYGVTIEAAPGAQFTDCGGGDGARIIPTSGSGHTLTITNGFVTIKGLEIHVYGSGSTSDECVRLGDATHACEGVRFSRCLLVGSYTLSQCDVIYAGNWDLGSSSNPVVIENCVLVEGERTCLHLQSFSGITDQYVDVVNTTVSRGKTHGIGYQTGNASSTLTMRIVNTIIGDSPGGNFEPSGTHSGTLTTTGSANNFDELGEIVGAGTPNPITFTVSAGGGDIAIFDSLTYPIGDLTLTDDGDNDVIGGGVGPSSNALVPDEDIFGVSRTGTTTDPGATMAQ